MNQHFRQITNFLLFLFSAVLLILCANTVFAQDKQPEPDNRIGIMSEAVVRARLSLLGYEKPTSVKLEDSPFGRIQINRRLIPTQQYEITTIKDGKQVLLKVDGLSGKIQVFPINNQ